MSREMTSDELPDGWASCEIGEISPVVGGGTPPSKDPSNFTNKGGTPWITPADLSGYREMYISRGARNLTDKGCANSAAKLLPEGALLFSSRAPVGYVAIASNPVCTNQGFKSFVLPSGFDPRFGYYYLRHIKPIAESRATGTTFKELSGAAAAKLPFKVAPLAEQKRIADKLEAVLGRVDACRARLDRVPALLKRFRQSVLAAATSGKLTSDWRKDTDDRETVPLRRAIRSIRTGPFGSSLHKADYVSGGTPIVNPMHINDGKIIPTVHMTVDSATLKRLSDFQLSTGDVIIGRRGEMGRCAVVGVEENGWLCGTGSMVLSPISTLNPEYLQIFLSSPGIVHALEGESVGSTMVNLNQKILLELEIFFPSLPEQQEIVRRVEDLFAFADRIEARLATARKTVERLTPSTLAKAFRGELVPQDPNDEPAGALLERLKPPIPTKSGPRRSRNMDSKLV